MLPLFEPKIATLPPAQREIWSQLAPARELSFVLYGGTAVALHLGHRQSIDFDFFNAESLDKTLLDASFTFLRDAKIIKEEPQTRIVSAQTSTEAVKISFFGAMKMGHINAPLKTADAVLLVASLEDLLATKLKAILDRAEAKDYADIAAMLASGVSLERGLAGFSAMFKNDPALPLRALGFFKDGDLPTVPRTDQDLLRRARDRVFSISAIQLKPGLLG